VIGLSAAVSSVPRMDDEAVQRERKRTATRAALSEAAMRLALRQGVQYVTADAIAVAAGIAPGTFRNYFASKEEAIVAPLLAQGRYFADLVRARPAGEPVWDSLRHAGMTMLSAPAEQMKALHDRLHLIRSHAALFAQHLTVFDESERLLAEAIADRVGLDAAADAYPRLQAGAAVLAMRIALDLWATGKSTGSLPDLTAGALDDVRAGLLQPGRPALAATS